MSDIRIIKKYPNRRLYDSELSQYITLADIRQYVLEGLDFVVIDVKTEEDITRTILLQIIAEQEHEGDPMFSTEMLSQIIRFYGQSMQSLAADYLQQSMKLFVSQQQQLHRRMADNNPLRAMTEMTRQNLDLWRDMQSRFFRAAMPDDKDDKGKK